MAETITIVETAESLSPIQVIDTIRQRIVYLEQDVFPGDVEFTPWWQAISQMTQLFNIKLSWHPSWNEYYDFSEQMGNLLYSKLIAGDEEARQIWELLNTPASTLTAV
jgi:hypothetical protein